MSTLPGPVSSQTKQVSGKQSQWDRVERMDEFKALLHAKNAFIIPATIFFLVYYFALPILVGYAPQFMANKVLGPLNLAYLFALSQFFMAWGIAWLYVRAARKFDQMSQDIIKRLELEGSK